MVRFLRQAIVAIALALTFAAAAQASGPVVLAAASLQESLNAAADGWTHKGHARPVIAFAASSALARQIEAGAPADLFISADEDWMNDIAAKGAVPREVVQKILAGRGYKRVACAGVGYRCNASSAVGAESGIVLMSSCR